jgi:hypothetical protein
LADPTPTPPPAPPRRYAPPPAVPAGDPTAEDVLALLALVAAGAALVWAVFALTPYHL